MLIRPSTVLTVSSPRMLPMCPEQQKVFRESTPEESDDSATPFQERVFSHFLDGFNPVLDLFSAQIRKNKHKVCHRQSLKP